MAGTRGRGRLVGWGQARPRAKAPTDRHAGSAQRTQTDASHGQMADIHWGVTASLSTIGRTVAARS